MDQLATLVDEYNGEVENQPGEHEYVWLETISEAEYLERTKEVTMPGTINGKKFVVVVDEGFADSWLEQVKKLLPDSVHGPVYIYETPDPVVAIVSDVELTTEELDIITETDTDEQIALRSSAN
jgi:hypothetical protein